jgi:hypothetical protein
MEIPKGKEHSINSERKVDYLKRKLVLLTKIKELVIQKEMTLLDEWKTLIKKDKEPRRSKNYMTIRTSGRDLNNWCSTRPR